MRDLGLWLSPPEHHPRTPTVTCFIIQTRIILKDLKSNAAVKLNEDDVCEAFCRPLSINADDVYVAAPPNSGFKWFRRPPAKAPFKRHVKKQNYPSRSFDFFFFFLVNLNTLQCASPPRDEFTFTT